VTTIAITLATTTTFASQVVQRYYKGMTLDIAKKALDIRSNFSSHEGNVKQKISIQGKFTLTYVDLDDLGQFRDHYVSGSNVTRLPIQFIRGLSLYYTSTLNLCGKIKITCIRHLR
jgi:hypothetical protein